MEGELVLPGEVWPGPWWELWVEWRGGAEKQAQLPVSQPGWGHPSCLLKLSPKAHCRPRSGRPLLLHLAIWVWGLDSTPPHSCSSYPGPHLSPPQQEGAWIRGLGSPQG